MGAIGQHEDHLALQEVGCIKQSVAIGCIKQSVARRKLVMQSERQG